MTDATAAGRLDDGWGTSDDYDIASFYTRASDFRGHSDNVRLRIKPEVLGEIEALVATRAIPEYTTGKDFMRDAIVHRLHWLSEHLDDPVLRAKLAEGVRRTIIDETTARYAQLIDSFEEMVTRTREVCERAIRFDDHLGVAAYLAEVIEYAANTREPYSTKLLAVVEHYRSQLTIEDELMPDMPLSGGVGPDAEHIDGGLGPEDEAA